MDKEILAYIELSNTKRGWNTLHGESNSQESKCGNGNRARKTVQQVRAKPKNRT